jgi:hypothetical protein
MIASLDVGHERATGVGNRAGRRERPLLGPRHERARGRKRPFPDIPRFVTPAYMDAWYVADALLRGSDIPSTKLRTIARNGDHADALYVLLFKEASGRSSVADVRKAVSETCPVELVESWVRVIMYIRAPNRRSLASLVDAIHACDPRSGIVMRLSRLTMVGSHRRTFANVIECAAIDNPFLAAGLGAVLSDLRSQVGPTRLIAKRDRRRHRRHTYVR